MGNYQADLNDVYDRLGAILARVDRLTELLEEALQEIKRMGMA